MRLAGDPSDGRIAQIHQPAEHDPRHQRRTGHGQAADPRILGVDHGAVEVAQLRGLRGSGGAGGRAMRSAGHIHDIIQRQTEADADIGHGEYAGIGGAAIDDALDGGAADRAGHGKLFGGDVFFTHSVCNQLDIQFLCLLSTVGHACVKIVHPLNIYVHCNANMYVIGWRQNRKPCAVRSTPLYAAQAADASMEGRENEKSTGQAAGEPHTHTGQLPHDIPLHTGAAGGAAHHQPQAAHDLRQSGRAARSEDRPAAAINNLPRNARQVAASMELALINGLCYSNSANQDRNHRNNCKNRKNRD